MLSPSSLLYLAGDRVTGTGHAMSLGIEIPCSGAKVDVRTLASVLLAGGYWSLREAGAVTLAVEQKKGLLGSRPRLAVRRSGSGAPAGLFDASLLDCVGEKDPWARDTAYRWLGRDAANPWGAVVGRVEAELATAAYLSVDAVTGVKAKVGAASRGRAAATPDCGAIARLGGEIDAAVGSWLAFRTGEAALADLLVKECKDGVATRLSSD